MGLHLTNLLSAALIALVVVGAIGIWTTSARSEIVVVPLGEYAISDACRACHGGNGAQWRSPVSAAETPTAQRHRLAEEGESGPAASRRLVRRFGAPARPTAAIRTVASHEQEGPDVLCAYCHVRGRGAPPAEAPTQAPRPGGAVADAACDGVCPVPRSGPRSRPLLPASFPRRVPQGG